MKSNSGRFTHYKRRASKKTLEKPNKIRDRATAFLRMRHEFAEKAEEK
jgi:hypothetical protein